MILILILLAWLLSFKFIVASIGLAYTLLALVATLMGYGAFIEVHLMNVDRKSLSDSPTVKIVQLSDLHVDWHTTPNRLNKFIREINRIQPDIILFTGDLIDNIDTYPHVDKLVAKLQELPTSAHKYAILGNHDFSDTDNSTTKIRKILAEAHFHLLENASTTLDVKGKRLAIGGIADLRHAKPDYDLVMPEADKALLMIHEPDIAHGLKVPTRYDIILAGHSHGGQINFAGLRLKNKGSKYYDRGWYKLNHRTQLYVNSGIGETFLPFRFMTPPSMLVLEL
jgi:predicted MPP superfamily phosphohydrolase